MSRDPYREPPRERWDRARLGAERERVEERERYVRGPGYRERSVEISERRGPREFEEERTQRRFIDDEPPRRAGGGPYMVEKERERDTYYTPRDRPTLLRRQSSLDTFDRRPLHFAERERYGPPAKYYPPAEDTRPGPPPLTPVHRLPPPKRYEREYYEEEEIDSRGFPERIKEREVIRRRRRSPDAQSKRSESSVTSTESSSSADETVVSSKSKKSAKSSKSSFPKKGTTRMPARLVDRRAIIAFGYPFEEEVRRGRVVTG